MEKIFNYFYIIKFIFYAGIASWEYSIGSKFTLAWFSIAILMLVLHFEMRINDIKEEKNENKIDREIP
jgi:hypothetical protein